jgi:very-short-patch-repair endonuclease
MPNAKRNRARSLRSTETKSEKLLWSILRGKQVCGLKFRRQHPISHFFADFACVSHKLVIEIDGGYHDVVIESDLNRESILRAHGWDVLRFSADDVEDDPESVAMAIAAHLELDYRFDRRGGGRSGMRKRS